MEDYMKKIIAVLSLLLTTISLNAESVEGTYFGLGIGSSQFKDGGYKDDLNNYLSSTDVKYDYSDVAIKLYGGYQFNKVIAVEASYTKYGKYNIDTIELQPSSVAIAANVGYNFGDNAEYRPFVTTGISLLNFGDNGKIKAYDNSSEAAIRVGVGFDYAPAKLEGMIFRLSYEGDVYKLDDANPTNIASFSNKYTQSTNMMYFGLGYKF